MNKFNIGLLVQDLEADKNIIDRVYKDVLENSDVLDFSIFFTRIGKMGDVKCGIFNSSSLADFNGHLICYNAEALGLALKVVNNIKLYGLCENINVLQYFTNKKINNQIKYLIFDEQQKRNFYRLTGDNGYVYDKNIINIIKELNHE